MEVIPEDLVALINSYIFGQCRNCMNVCHYKNIKHDYSIQRYVTIFDDDYGMENMKTYTRICFSCIHFFEHSKWWITDN